MLVISLGLGYADNEHLASRPKEFVDRQLDSGRYSSVSEYVRELIRDDEKRRAQERLEGLLLEGLQSGAATEMTRQDWIEIREDALRRLQNRKSPG